MWSECTLAGVEARPTNKRLTVVLQKLVDEVHMGQQHAAAAVALQAEGVERITAKRC